MVGWGGVEVTGGLSEANPDTLALKARRRCTFCIEQPIEWLIRSVLKALTHSASLRFWFTSDRNIHAIVSHHPGVRGSEQPLPRRSRGKESSVLAATVSTEGKKTREGGVWCSKLIPDMDALRVTLYT